VSKPTNNTFSFLRLFARLFRAHRLGDCHPAAGWSALAQSPPAIPEGFDLHGSMRLRYETIDGQARPGFKPGDELVDLRTIVTATYKSGSFRAGAEVYDSRTWLANAHTPISTNEVNTLEPVQAWVAVDIARPFGPGTTLAIQGGRFQLNLGSGASSLGMTIAERPMASPACAPTSGSGQSRQL
jgi:hypothetical protein